MTDRDLETTSSYTTPQRNLLKSMRSTAGWAEHGLCHGDALFTEEFFTGYERKARDKYCREICQRCPVQINCLMHALEFPETTGFWGGYNLQQRSELRKKRRTQRLEIAQRDRDSWISSRE